MPSPQIETCGICSRPRSEHGAETIHAFRGRNETAGLVARSHESPSSNEGIAQGRQGMPARASSDAILRMVLIRKGIVTVAEIDAIEAELRATGVVTDDLTIRSSDTRDR